MKDIKVTVCIPTYNRVGYLKESIDAVLAQEYKAFHLIIMDNCSVDGTREFASTLKDARVRYVRNRENLGLWMNWRQALGQVDTDYFVMVADDDIILPGYLGKTVAELDRHPSAGFAFTLSGTLDAAGRDQARSFPRDPPREGLLLENIFFDMPSKGATWKSARAAFSCGGRRSRTLATSTVCIPLITSIPTSISASRRGFRWCSSTRRYA